MSQLAPSIVTCPRCGERRSRSLYTSLDADTMPHEVDAIVAGRFEQQTCTACDCTFQPEHRLLFASHARRLWIVMYPISERRDFEALEDAVGDVIEEGLAHASAAARERLRGLAPRLVFGQHMLAEAVRAGIAGLDPALLECAKLLTVRRNLGTLMARGPFELCLEALEDAGAVCGVHTLPAGERRESLRMSPQVFAELAPRRADLEAEYPELFERPYVSATRYLLEDTV